MIPEKIESERIVIFIDNSNIFRGFKKYKVKVDYEKLKKVISQNRNLQAIILYEGIIYPINPYKKKWYEDLKKNSWYCIKTSFDKRTSKTAIEKKIDVKIAIDIISFAYESAYDTAILVSGDGDFLPVIKKLKKLNKNIEIWAFRYSLANVIKDELDQENIHYLDDNLSKIMMWNEEKNTYNRSP